MTKFAMFTSTVAVALAAYVLIQQQEAGPRGPDDRIAALEQSVADIAATLERIESARAPELLPAPAPSPTAGGLVRARDEPAPLGGTATASGDGESPKTVEERLAKLEKIASVFERGANFVESAAGDGMIMSPFGRKHITSMASAQSLLDLDDAQVADMERIFETAREELERLKDTPNEAGKTLREIEKGLAFTITEGEQPDMSTIFKSIGEITTFKQGKVPGTNETYGEAEQRIHKRAMADARHGLNAEQQKEWDGAAKHGLLPGGSGTVTTAFSIGDGGAMFGGFSGNEPDEK